MLINTENLEKLLVINWTKFLDYRGLLSFIQLNNNINEFKMQQLSLSRFEFTDDGFIIWADYTIDNKQFTTELLLKDSSITHIQTVEN